LAKAREGRVNVKPSSVGNQIQQTYDDRAASPEVLLQLGLLLGFPGAPPVRKAAKSKRELKELLENP
jgi:hypothetical protein